MNRVSDAVVCQMCGKSPDPDVDGDPPITWVMDRRQDGRVMWTCLTCASTHIRSMEAKLDSEWW